MTQLAIPAVLDLPASTRLVDVLRAIDGPMVLDGSEVERIGVAGLQILLSARATAIGAGVAFDIQCPSDALRAAAITAGAEILLASGL